MKRLYKVRCEVNMDKDQIIEVIVETNYSHRAVNIATNQLRDDGFSYIYPISCSEVIQ